MRQAAAKTNDLAGDGTTTSVVLAQGLIAEGVKVYCEIHLLLKCLKMLNLLEYFSYQLRLFVSRWLQLVQTLS